MSRGNDTKDTEIKKSTRKNLVSKIARTHSKRFIVQDNMATPHKKNFQETVSSVDVHFEKNLNERSADKHGRRRSIDPNSGLTYVEIISSSSGNVFMQESPERTNNPAHGEVLFKGIPTLNELRKNNPKLFENPKTSDFVFKITSEDIIKRINAKRPQSQNQVVGRSAKDIFEECGAIINEKVGKEVAREYHHAHRHGWSLGGSQTKDNLDPGTAGSNYTTLFTLEEPIKRLLAKEKIDGGVEIKGTITYHPLVPLPRKITYHVSWKKERFVNVEIYPLEHRRPTRSELKVANAFYKVVRSPIQTAGDRDAARAQLTTYKTSIAEIKETNTTKLQFDDEDLEDSTPASPGPKNN